MKKKHKYKQHLNICEQHQQHVIQNTKLQKRVAYSLQ